jgi:hypothetical protein
VGRLATSIAVAGVTLLFSCFSCVAGAGTRSGFFAPGVAPKAPEIMLYFSHAIGGGPLAGGASHPTFGLRVQQVREGGNSGDPESGDVMHRRELLNWQMEARPNFHLGDMRIQLGRRLTYDVTHARFGSPGHHSAIRLELPSYRDALPPSGFQRVPGRQPDIQRQRRLTNSPVVAADLALSVALQNRPARSANTRAN